MTGDLLRAVCPNCGRAQKFLPTRAEERAQVADLYCFDCGTVRRVQLKPEEERHGAD